MRKIKNIIVIFIILINSLTIPVYADDENTENEMTKEELSQILETAGTLEGIPKINARNAVVFDRISRRCNIWEK